MKHQKTQCENPFKTAQLKNPGVERGDKSERLDVETLVATPTIIDVQTSRGFVNVPQNKEALHPCFERLYLLKATAKGMSVRYVIDNLDISDELFDDFLNEKVSVGIDFAKKLELVTGMPFDFWLRIQSKFDYSINVHSIK
ncbi:hypothetical protein [Thalassotalea sp. PP2-459]|uniref:helix-turn-helix transcriptional regulator n=1 Tax=Thalassotalea sp. PP2-459 TaxID=1742724 RepID=UPI0009428172|nr:hypothetical protein [Thalassotalea sp. PP2-459]OKY27509.1 hypothetical protein BI291_08720 [Thalassotalea sp. PP2-459]